MWIDATGLLVFVILITSLIGAFKFVPFLSKGWHITVAFVVLYILQVLLFF